MITGYILGCLLSVLLWRFDKQRIFFMLNSNLSKILKNKIIIQLIYLILVTIVCIALSFLKNDFVYNAIIGFIVIDISSTERENLLNNDEISFYNSISTVSKSLINGFIGPLFYIIIGGNPLGIAFTLICNLNLTDDYSILNLVDTIFSIVPAIISNFLLYVIYIIKFRKLRIDFKRDFLINSIARPRLNMDILAANIESVHFYTHFNKNSGAYIKSYGGPNNKINAVCIREYIKIIYGICTLFFIAFIIAVSSRF